MKKLLKFVNDLSQLKAMISDKDLLDYHQQFDLHLSRKGYQPELRSVVGRVKQEHVVLGKVMQYGELPVFRAAILDNWAWMPLDPPQPILGEHNYWEICYQMGFAARKLYCNFVGKKFRGRMYTPYFFIEMHDKLMFGQRASVEVRLSERAIERKNMDICTMFFRFYTSKKKVTAEAGLKVLCFPRDFEILTQQAKAGNEDARGRLVDLIRRKAKQRKLLGLNNAIDPESLIAEIMKGSIIEEDIAKIFDLW